MPWNNQGSGGNGQGSNGPWGRGPSGQGGRPGGNSPDFEEWLKRGQERLKQLLPGTGFASGGFALVALGLVVVWLLSGIYFVTAQEQGVVLRFGEYSARTTPGMHYHLPWPIETVETPEVTTVNQITIGYRLSNEPAEEAQPDELREEGLMLTGDENIVDVNFAVGWYIKDAAAFLFNVENAPDIPGQTIKAVAESAMREIVGQSQIEPILTQDRAPVENRVRELTQKTLDSYHSGVAIAWVKLQKADVPEDVQAAYRDVQVARANQEQKRNEAEAYANKVVPVARGQAAKIVQDAEAYRQKVIAEAEGEAKRFLSVYEEYRKAPEITRRRMYLETMSQVLGDTRKIVIDDSVGKGVVPYLPLPGLEKRTPAVSVTEPPSASSSTGAQQ